MTLAFVPMHLGTKKPMRKDWNKRENCLFGDDALNQLSGHNVAIALAYCDPPMGCLDIDDTTTALEILGLDPMSLDAPVCTSGKTNSLKVFFKLEEPLESIAVKHKGRVSFEYRCATKDGLTVPDCIPPSIHPERTTYHWVTDTPLRAAPYPPPQMLCDWQSRIASSYSNARVDRLWRGSGAACASSMEKGEVCDLLSYISPDCDRATWLRVIFSTMSTGLPDAAQIALDWSKGSPEKFNFRDFKSAVRSYRPGKISPGSLVHFAKEGGYVGRK